MSVPRTWALPLLKQRTQHRLLACHHSVFQSNRAIHTFASFVECFVFICFSFKHNFRAEGRCCCCITSQPIVGLTNFCYWTGWLNTVACVCVCVCVSVWVCVFVSAVYTGMYNEVFSYLHLVANLIDIFVHGWYIYVRLCVYVCVFLISPHDDFVQKKNQQIKTLSALKQIGLPMFLCLTRR